MEVYKFFRYRNILINAALRSLRFWSGPKDLDLCNLASCPAGKNRRKNPSGNIVHLFLVLARTSAECNQGVNWHNWSHTEAGILNECTCSSHFPSSEFKDYKMQRFYWHAQLPAWKFERVSTIVRNVNRRIFTQIFPSGHETTVNFRLVVHITQCWNMNWPIAFSKLGSFAERDWLIWNSILRFWTSNRKFTVCVTKPSRSQVRRVWARDYARTWSIEQRFITWHVR